MGAMAELAARSGAIGSRDLPFGRLIAQSGGNESGVGERQHECWIYRSREYGSGDVSQPA